MGPLRDLLSPLLAIVTLRIRLWDRTLAQRGQFVRVVSWVGVLGAFVLVGLLAYLAVGLSRVLGADLATRAMLVMAAVTPILLVTDSMLRVGQGEGLAAALYHYPLSPGVIHAGELVAGLASPIVVGSAVVLAAAQITTGTHWVVAVPSALILGSFLLSLGLILRLSAASMLRRRLMREAALVGSMVVLLGLWIGMMSTLGNGDVMRLVSNPPPIPGWAWYLPPAWFVTPGAVVSGIPQAARWLGILGGPVLVLAAFAFGARLQDMACHGESDAMGAGRARRYRPRGNRITDRMPLRLVHPAVWAAAGKEIKSVLRDPFLLLMLTSQGVLLLVLPLLFRSGVITGHSQRLDGMWTAYMPFFVLLLVLAKQAPVFNQVAMEGRGLLFLAQVPVDRGLLVVGKNLAYFGLFGAIDAVFMLAAALVFDVLPLYPYYLAMAAVGLVLMLGVGNLVSVWLPAQWIGARASMGGSRAAQAASEGGVERPGCGVTIGRMLAVQFLYVLLAPPLFGMYAARVWLTGGTQIAAVVAVASYCAIVYIVGTSLAVVSFESAEQSLRARFATRGSG